MNALPTPNFAFGPDRRALLQLLLHEGQAGATAQSVAILPRASGEAPVLSFGQERLWFLDVLRPGSWAYVIFHSVRLTGAANADALEWAVNDIVRRHEVLRSNFIARDGCPTVVVASSRHVSLHRIDLSHLPSEEREAEMMRLLNMDAHAPFDLTAGALLRVTLIALGPLDHVLAVSIHHIVADAWSMDLFFNELFTVCNAAAAGRPSPIPDLPIQYADYAAWHRRQLAGETLESLLSYWRRQLAGAPPLIPLPTDRPRPPVQSGAGARQSFFVRTETIEPLRRVGRELNATLFMVLLTPFKALLFKLSGEPHIIVGTPNANRNRTEVERLIGFFVNTLVLHTDLSGDPTARELMARVRDVTVGAYAHQDMPFEKLVEYLKPKRSRAYNPLFQVMFNLQNALPAPSVSALEFETAVVDETQILPGAPKFDMEWALLQHPRGVTVNMEYSTDLYSHATIAQLARAYRKLIGVMAANPDLPLSRLPLGATKPAATVACAEEFDFGA
jgi:Condensation domain